MIACLIIRGTTRLSGRISERLFSGGAGRVTGHSVSCTAVLALALQSACTLTPPRGSEQDIRSTNAEAMQAQSPGSGLPTSTPSQSGPSTSELPTLSTRFPRIDTPQQTGVVQNPELVEISGLAASPTQDGVLWMMNDGGNEAALFAVSGRGITLGRWPVAAVNRDWEDLAATRWQSENWLLIADIGDNRRQHTESRILIVPEPSLSRPRKEPLKPVATLRFQYEDGPHDAEAMAVSGEELFILTKQAIGASGASPSRLYRLPWSLTPSPDIQIAEFLGPMNLPPMNLEARLIGSVSGVDVRQPTALGLHASNRHAYVLSYRSIHRFTRAADESWADALLRPGQRIHRHDLRQAEALDVADDGSIWFTTESSRPALWALPAATASP